MTITEGPLSHVRELDLSRILAARPCDLIITAEDTKFGQAENRVGSMLVANRGFGA